MNKKWVLYSGENDNNELLYQKISPLMTKILKMKGISDLDEMTDFLSSQPKKTYDPFMMKNMKEVVDVVLSTVKNNKTICIYGDYDVDGLSSVSLMMQLLSQMTTKCFYYIPSRFEEGYGLNKEALKSIKNDGADLVITVDCGSVSVEEVAYAKSIGLDIIVTDHHNTGEATPDCLILNPKQLDCSYPFEHLCGCGVAFKLAQGIQRQAQLPKSILNGLLDLVAIATVADIVPLLGENRTLVKYGLTQINKRKRRGLKTLIEGVGLRSKNINAYHIAYIIGPHLNAGGRIDTAKAGVELFLSNEEAKINQYTRLLIELNRQRKNLQEEGFVKCKEIVEACHKDDLFLVIDSGNIHEGVTGIIASKIKERFYRPTVIVTQSQEKGLLKGTGRSIPSIDIYEEIKKVDHLMLKFGGHKGACGFTIDASNVAKLRGSLNDEMEQIKKNNPEHFVHEITIASQLELKQVTMDLIKELEQLEPYGHKNEKPFFVLQNLSVKNTFYMGDNKQHLKIRCEDDKGNILEAIAFNMSEYYNQLNVMDQCIDIVGYPEINEYNKMVKIQFLMTDIKKTSNENLLIPSVT